MATQPRYIRYDEFIDSILTVFESVAHEGEVVIVEIDEGELVVLKPVDPRKSLRRRKREADHKAFLASAGGWKDVDVDHFLADNYKSRDMATRPSIDL
jgi:hypothetical protein